MLVPAFWRLQAQVILKPRQVSASRIVADHFGVG